jgi:flagellar motor switch protein FliM
VVALEPMLEKVGAEYTFYGSRPQRKDSMTPELLEEIVMRSKTKVIAEMVGSVISVRDLLKMQVGDIVRLDNNATDESCVTVKVGDRSKFKAKQGRIGSKQGIQIVARLR